MKPNTTTQPRRASLVAEKRKADRWRAGVRIENLAGQIAGGMMAGYVAIGHDPKPDDLAKDAVYIAGRISLEVERTLRAAEELEKESEA